MVDEGKNTPSTFTETLLILNKRAKSVKLATFFLVYALIAAVIIVLALAGYIKNNGNSNSISRFISSAIDSSREKDSKALLEAMVKAIDNPQKYTPKKNESPPGNLGLSTTQLESTNSFHLFKSTSEKIADSLSAVILSLSLMIFVGFVMKAILVFIRYYMQLGTDFENQKIAYLMSKGDEEGFKSLLKCLRSHNINFEKTPTPPQEKIITSLIDALKLERNNNKIN